MIRLVLIQCDVPGCKNRLRLKWDRGYFDLSDADWITLGLGDFASQYHLCHEHFMVNMDELRAMKGIVVIPNVKETFRHPSE